MSLNIKNDRVHDLARRAARLSGATQTGAIEEALSRYLAELETEADGGDGRRARVDLILSDMRVRIAADDVPLATDDLYDDTGLPA